MVSATQPTSSSRVVTRNLLISASRAETNSEVQESSIHDLSTVINLVTLYDELFVLNKAPGTDSSGDTSDLIRLLSDEQLIKTQELDDKDREAVHNEPKSIFLFILTKTLPSPMMKPKSSMLFSDRPFPRLNTCRHFTHIMHP